MCGSYHKGNPLYWVGTNTQRKNKLGGGSHPLKEAIMSNKVDTNTLILIHIALNTALQSLLESANQGHQKAFNEILGEVNALEIELSSRGVHYTPIDFLH